MINSYSTSYIKQANSGQNLLTVLIVLCVLLAVAVCYAFGTLAKSEARRQKRSETAWFWLGFFFGLNAFIALKVSRAADEEAHSLMLWSTLGVLFGLSAILAFEAGLNAENKGHDFDCWCILGFSSGLVAVFISCFLKPFVRQQTVSVEKQQGIPVKTNNLAKTVSKDLALSSSKDNWVCTKCSNVNDSSKYYCTKCGAIKR